jgi:hypothetical protein
MQLSLNTFGATGLFDRGNWKKNGPGFAASAAVHALLLLVALYFFIHPAEVTQTVSRVLPVDIVHLGAETESPAAPVKSPVPKAASAPRGEPSSMAPAGVSHDEKKPLPEDAFDAKLHALSQLRQPDAKLKPLDNSGTDDATIGGDVGTHATYSLRDYVRAQVLRHWNLDYSMLGDHRFVVAIRVEMTNHGVITVSEIVDKARYTTDPIYHEIALSARNAVTLSSPIPLPPGTYQPVMSFVLNLNPRDTNR